MDVRIGVTYTAKELDLELDGGTDVDKLREEIEAALAGDDAVLWMTDKRGRSVGIPSDKVAYVEIGSPGDDRRIGFGS